MCLAKSVDLAQHMEQVTKSRERGNPFWWWQQILIQKLVHGAFPVHSRQNKSLFVLSALFRHLRYQPQVLIHIQIFNFFAFLAIRLVMISIHWLFQSVFAHSLFSLLLSLFSCNIFVESLCLFLFSYSSLLNEMSSSKIPIAKAHIGEGHSSSPSYQRFSLLHAKGLHLYL